MSLVSPESSTEPCRSESGDVSHSCLVPVRRQDPQCTRCAHACQHYQLCPTPVAVCCSELRTTRASLLMSFSFAMR